MIEALARAACLIVVLLWIWWLPAAGIVALIAVLIAWALVANRTPPMPIAGSTVLVTGASSGLGRAIALEAARRRASRVILVARSQGGLEETANQLRVESPWCTPLIATCDVTDPVAIDALRDRVLGEWGVPDLLVNNAGAGTWLRIEEGTHADAQAHIACPYLGAVWLCQALIPAMAERRRGHVLNVTSGASIGFFRGASTYGPARWAMRGFSGYLRADCADLGVGVTLLNAAEVTGTAYFAEGKAGARSRERIPWPFQGSLVQSLTPDAAGAARAGLDGVERGTFEVLAPTVLMVPTKVLVDLFPEVLYHLLALGGRGRPERTATP